MELRETADDALLSSAVRTIPVDTTSDRLRPIVETIERGTHKRNSPSPEPHPRPAIPAAGSSVERPLEYDGAYYTLSLTNTVERMLTKADIRVNAATMASDDATTAVEYETLSETDSAALRGALPPETGDREYESTHEYYDQQELTASVLVPEMEIDAVVRDGQRYPVELASTEEIQGYTYHYEAERVASTADDFLAWLRSNYRFELTGLSDAEGKIVTEAIEESRYAGDEEDDAFRSLSDRFLSHPALEREEETGDWFVRYDGTEYVAALRPPQAYA
ncbi:hypothetical protein FGF80_07440 [Natrinema pallidum]|uniref:Uncharacterized protein n=2 Tax=Natrinema pallidum TaxID=69527 RepID=A0A4P9TJ12_9EURY|nr:hypothetical protein FGF80_07440 [Natrinema pallidum]